MNKISKILMLFAALIICCGTLKASEVNKKPIHYVYWFSVNIKLDNVNKTIEILDSERNVISGLPKSFSKAVKQGFANNQVVIGPFHTEKEAKNASIYYKKSKDEIGELPQSNAPNEVHWFHIALMENSKDSYKFTRSPAAVSSGSANEFVKDLFENFEFQRIVIGPFGDYNHAEEAKFILRQFEK